jgi:hypothetical protein
VLGLAPARLLALGISKPVKDAAGTRYFEPDGVNFCDKAEHAAPEWQAAMEALIHVATLGAPTMFAHVFNPPAKYGY